jgi:hypothetical protein
VPFSLRQSMPFSSASRRARGVILGSSILAL